MLRSSAKSEGVNKPTGNVSQKDMKDDVLAATPTTDSNAAPSFIDALELIMSMQILETPIDTETIHALRLTSKATRSVVDSFIKTFDHDADDGHSLDEISPWPWPNVTSMTVSTINIVHIGQKRDIDYLVTLPLLKLESLFLEGRHIAPLAQSNWPVLTKLTLRLDSGEEPEIPCPPDLVFPKFLQLKILSLYADEVDDVQTLGFLYRLLKSCPEVTSLKIQAPDRDSCTEEIARMIISASLTQLKSLEIYENNSFSYISTTLFAHSLYKWSWPSLTSILIDGSENRCCMLSRLTSTSWVANLKDIELYLNDQIKLSDLRAFLQILEKGIVENLILYCLDFPNILPAFDGIKLDHLKSLSVDKIRLSPSFYGADVSDTMNVFFDSCTFPKIESISIAFDVEFITLEYNGNDGDSDAEADIMPRWCRPPATSVAQLEHLYPKLYFINLEGPTISRDLADYLGNFRKATGCGISVVECTVHEKEFSAVQRQFLQKLGVEIDSWKEHQEDSPMYEECLYWNTLSDDYFQLSVYHLAIVNAVRRGPKAVENLLVAIEADIEKKELTVFVSDALRKFSKELDGIRRIKDSWLEVSNWIYQYIDRSLYNPMEVAKYEKRRLYE